MALSEILSKARKVFPYTLTSNPVTKFEDKVDLARKMRGHLSNMRLSDSSPAEISGHELRHAAWVPDGVPVTYSLQVGWFNRLKQARTEYGKQTSPLEDFRIVIAPMKVEGKLIFIDGDKSDTGYAYSFRNTPNDFLVIKQLAGQLDTNEAINSIKAVLGSKLKRLPGDLDIDQHALGIWTKLIEQKKDDSNSPI